MAFVLASFASCGSDPLPVVAMPPAAPLCLVWACTEALECVAVTCEEALPLMERELCVEKGRCLEI